MTCKRALSVLIALALITLACALCAGHSQACPTAYVAPVKAVQAHAYAYQAQLKVPVVASVAYFKLYEIPAYGAGYVAPPAAPSEAELEIQRLKLQLELEKLRSRQQTPPLPPPAPPAPALPQDPFNPPQSRAEPPPPATHASTPLTFVARCSKCHDLNSADNKGGGTSLFNDGRPLVMESKTKVAVVVAILKGTMPKGVKLPETDRLALASEVLALK